MIQVQSKHLLIVDSTTMLFPLVAKTISKFVPDPSTKPSGVITIQEMHTTTTTLLNQLQFRMLRLENTCFKSTTTTQTTIRSLLLPKKTYPVVQLLPSTLKT